MLKSATWTTPELYMDDVSVIGWIFTGSKLI